MNLLLGEARWAIESYCLQVRRFDHQLLFGKGARAPSLSLVLGRNVDWTREAVEIEATCTCSSMYVLFSVCVSFIYTTSTMLQVKIRPATEHSCFFKSK